MKKLLLAFIALLFLSSCASTSLSQIEKSTADQINSQYHYLPAVIRPRVLSVSLEPTYPPGWYIGWVTFKRGVDTFYPQRILVYVPNHNLNDLIVIHGYNTGVGR